MIEFFRKLFATETSGATARERLRLVLLSDHLSLAPDVVQSLRADLIAVISKYVEVDEANCDVSFEQQDRAVAVLANIPIVSMRSRPSPPPAPPAPPAVPRSAPDGPPVAGPATASLVFDDAGAGNSRAPALPRRRKRRRRAASAPVAG